MFIHKKDRALRTGRVWVRLVLFPGCLQLHVNAAGWEKWWCLSESYLLRLATFQESMEQLKNRLKMDLFLALGKWMEIKTGKSVSYREVENTKLMFGNISTEVFTELISHEAIKSISASWISREDMFCGSQIVSQEGHQGSVYIFYKEMWENRKLFKWRSVRALRRVKLVIR